jgi:hypothetical protein
MKKAIKPVRAKAPVALKKPRAKLAKPKKSLASPKQPRAGPRWPKRWRSCHEPRISSRGQPINSRRRLRGYRPLPRLSIRVLRHRTSPHLTQSQSGSPMLPIPQLNRIRAKTHEADVDGENLAMQLLQRHLAALDSGAIADIGKLAALLAGCWHQFEGTHAQGMHAGKLHAWKRCIGNHRY